MSFTVLLTGATGFLGGALATRLVASDHTVVALVRGQNLQQATARMTRSLSRFVGPIAAESAVRCIKVIVGDLTSCEVYDRPEFETVTHVVHSAACTSFASEREVWRSNVEGTKCLAERMHRSARLRRFLHVSTAYCCGDRPNRIVHEDDAPRDEHGYVNEYTRSKAAAELHLASMNWGERLVVARPSIVIGDTALGVQPSSSLFWYYRALAALRCGPFVLDDRRDIVPVDYVADALSFLLTLDRPKFGTYHVSAGTNGSQCLGEILPLLVPAEIGTNATEWRRVSASALADMGVAIRGLVRDESDAKKLARGLGACAKFGELGVQCFDNGRLLSEGFRAPPRFGDYAATCLRTSEGATIFDQMIDDA